MKGEQSEPRVWASLARQMSLHIAVVTVVDPTRVCSLAVVVVLGLVETTVGVEPLRASPEMMRRSS
jgi:hypothetical protein